MILLIVYYSSGIAKFDVIKYLQKDTVPNV